METISQIFTQSAQLASYDYVVLTLNNRRNRRKIIFSDRPQYERLIFDYNLEVDRILDQAVEEILSCLNLTKEVFESSIQNLLEMGWFQ